MVSCMEIQQTALEKTKSSMENITVSSRNGRMLPPNVQFHDISTGSSAEQLHIN